MTDQAVDVAVIGGGPAGLAAAVAAKEHGAAHVLVIDRNSWLGGILPQCIHDGFGLEETGEPMTGPEYAARYIQMAKKHHITIMNETMVLQLKRTKEIGAINKQGIHTIQANAIVLAMGCREKTRWHALIPGDRPSGIFTAGVAQAFINLYNIMPGKNVVILGSGDVGLIMARRLKFEGAKVLGVVEILPHASGLPRNVVQCLDDYGIPLFLKHTVTCIKGKDRLEQLTISQVDEHMVPIDGTKQKIACDTLLLSLGLIPENEVSKQANIELDPITGGPIVNQQLETSLDGVFACGNCLQVYDVVDMLSHDAKKAGKYAALYDSSTSSKKGLSVVAGEGVGQVVPQKITEPRKTELSMRSNKIRKTATFQVMANKKEIFRKKLPFTNPANMIKVTIDITAQLISSGQPLEVTIHD